MAETISPVSTIVESLGALEAPLRRSNGRGGFKLLE